MKRTTVPPALAFALALLLGAATGPASAAEALESPLAGLYDRWLLGVSHLLLDEERQAFAALDDDLERELFIRRFWQAHAADPTLLGRWRDSFEEARRRFPDLGEDRARALLVAGKPAAVVSLRSCGERIRPLEIWSYEPWHTAYRFHLLFYRDSNLARGVYRHWSRHGGTTPLVYRGRQRAEAGLLPWSAAELVAYAVAESCLERPADAATLEAALADALDAAELAELLAPPAVDPAWLAAFEAELETAPTLPARLAEITFPGRYQQKTILHGRLLVPAAEMARSGEGLLFDRLAVQGEVRLGDRLVDAFEVVHHVAGSAPGDRVEIDFYRRLRPATYRLELRLEDACGRGLLRLARSLEVPRLEAPAEPPAGRWNGFAALTRSRVGVLTTFPSVELLAPAEGPAMGRVEILALTAGGPIERIDFLLDGEPAASDPEPPWSALLDLGPEPRRRTVAAVAFDPAGRRIAGDQMVLPATARRFAVRLVEPTPEAVRAGAVRRLRAVVEVPPGENLDRLELYRGEDRIATLRQPPWSHPLEPRPAAARASFLRAVAWLENGRSSEDVLVLDAAAALEEIDVHLVELYTTVLDPQGRPVTGLDGAAFRVLEDGVEQPLRRFATVESLAINVALLMDVSGSMRGRVRMASRSARRFFDTVLRPRDLASLSVFNHDIRRLVPFTADVERLRHGAVGLRAFGTTRLHDSLIYTVYSFGGLDGKRALVLLSDGQDVDSDFRFKQVREATLRSGIAVYPILLDLDDEETRTQLVELARETGGSSFMIRQVAELDRVYRQIEQELRSQYLLVYEAPSPTARGVWRRIEVEVVGEGLTARTIRGYSP